MRARTTIITGFEGQSLGPAWQDPASTWFETIERYMTFIQIPGWRARAPHQDGREPKACSTPSEASRLRDEMLRVVQTHAVRRAKEPAECCATREDLRDLLAYVGRHITRDERCSREVHRHLQRAFLLNEQGYACVYCGRTAWGTFAEDTGRESRRTLRFEVDHKTTRRRLPDRDLFDPQNLVIACRSCNTIKAELTPERFEIELRSLARAVVAKKWNR